MKHIITFLLLFTVTVVSPSNYIDPPPVAIVTATVYNAEPGQTDDTPFITASGYRINPKKLPKIIAVSRDLEKIIPLGSVVRIKGTAHDGIYRVEDRMHHRWKNKIDILVPPHIRVGKWHKVLIYKISKT